MTFWTLQGISQYKQGGVAHSMMVRDSKFATDLVQNDTAERKYILRRLTPTECARLQGFPDWWVDGAEGSDTAEYKLWGNGIALPCAADVLGRVVKALGQETESVSDWLDRLLAE